MKVLLNKKKREPKPPEFIILNEKCQVFCGLRGGYPIFSDDLNDAKPLINDSQFKTVQQGTFYKLEKEFIK